MCGLTGLLDSSGRPEADLRAIVGPMTDALVHRGPDAGGVWSAEGVAFGHRRLAILDISPAGAQPMLSADGRFVITFNGEIYNHLDLRRALEQADAAPNWQGHSDTETLLAGISCWGLDQTLRRAAGMFALALWDRRDKRLSLARDRIGEKPLYWGWAGKTIVFGSELKALAAHPEFQGEICRDALADFLSFAYVPAPRSIWRGVYKLEPGTILDIGGLPRASAPPHPLRPGDSYGPLSIRRYWSLNQAIDEGALNPICDEHEAVDEVERVLGLAIQRQTISDVPLGAFLSGGIDSSLIVALMQSRSAHPVRTFTVGFEDNGFNEAPFAAAIARYLGTDHTEVIVTEKQAREVIPDLSRLYDEPFADSSQIPTYLVSRIAKSHVSVALSGDAGDELFGGYTRYSWAPRIWRQLARVPFPVRRLMATSISAVPGSVWNNFGTGAFSHTGDKARKLAESLRHARTLDDMYRSLISVWPVNSLTPANQTGSGIILNDPLPACLDEDAVARMMAQDMRAYLPDDVLCKVDRAAMGASLETRVPFLDPDVLSLSARLPTGMKVRDSQGKWVVRQVLYRHVPGELIDRPKTGFGIPIGDWLRGPLRSWACDLLSPDALKRDGLIDPAPVTRAWSEHLSGRRDWTHRLWIVLMLQAWRQAPQ